MAQAVATPGLMFKSSSANMFNSLMRYAEMRMEIKHATREHSGVLKAGKALEREIKRHNIEKFDEDYKELFNALEESSNSTHKLAINDFIAMKVLSKLIRRVNGEEEEIEKEMKQAAKKGTVMKKDELVKQLNRFRKQHKQGDMEEEDDKKAVLKKLRLLVNGIYHLCEGHMDSALFLRSKTFIDWRIFNYFRMRGKAIDIRKDISKAKHSYEDVRKRHSELVRVFKEKKVNASEAKKMVKAEENSFRVLSKDLKKFGKYLHDAFMAVGLLFSDAMLLLSISVKKVKGEEEEVQHWAEDHQLPTAIFTWGQKREKEVLDKVKASMHEMNKDLLQLGG